MMVPVWLLYVVYVIAGYALVGWIWHAWHRRGGKMTPEEVEEYLQLLKVQMNIPADFKDDFIERLRVFGNEDDGMPTYNLNLLRFNEELADIEGLDKSLVSTPAESNAYYEKYVLPVIVSIGGFPMFSSEVIGQSITPSSKECEDWHRSLVVYYPNRRAFFKLVTHPDYMRVAAYKIGALKVTLLPTKKDLVMPLSITFINMMTFTLNLIFTLTTPFRRDK